MAISHANVDALLSLRQLNQCRYQINSNIVFNVHGLCSWTAEAVL